MRQIIAMAGVLMLSACAPVAHAAFTPGADTTFGWEYADLNALRAKKKPALLYVYDSSVKTGNSMAQFIEQTLFGVGHKSPNPKVREACSDFYKIRVRHDDRGWPAEMVGKGQGGAVMYILTCDGTVVNMISRGNQGSTNDFINNCKTATTMNPAAAAKLEKSPPPKFEHRKIEEPKEKEQKTEPGEKEPEKVGAIPGLGGDGEKKTAAPKKTEENKGGKLEDE